MGTVITRAPQRISFLGGGSDYPYFFNEEPGCVLGMAIQCYNYMALSINNSPLNSWNYRFVYSQVEEVQNISQIRHSYFKKFLENFKTNKFNEFHSISDLPAGAGLGSSSSFLTALIGAYIAKNDGKKFNQKKIAKEVIYFENSIMNKNGGIQDQLFASHGGFNFINFYQNSIEIKKPKINKERLNELISMICLVPTGKHRVNNKITTDLKSRYENNKTKIRELVQFAKEGVSILEGNSSLLEFASLVDKSWIVKKTQSNLITNEEIDNLYQYGIGCGAVGGKLLGAGGGGYILFFVEPEFKQRFVKKIDIPNILFPKLDNSGFRILST